ncbi:MAG: cobalt ECF transporter T component CbiQ [Candidatus Helarchaeota archaeon]|nr:cobalt ECF transporter T component CbiQ [Candidatus Helarchaeota archaeon]
MNMSFMHIVPHFLLMGVFIGIMAFSRVSIRYYFARTLFFITIFAVVIALPVIFFTPGQIIAVWSIGTVNIIVTLEGVVTASSFVLRVWLSIMAVMTLIFTTPFANLIHAMKHVRIPQVFLILFSLTYRYIFLFIEELIRMLRAKEARSFRSLGFRLRFKILGQVFGTLLVRSIGKSERVYRAMLARGYKGDFITKEYKSSYLATGLYTGVIIIVVTVIFLIDLQIIPFVYLF